MRYAINGFFAGLVTGGTCFLVQAYPTTELAAKHETTRQTGYYIGLTIGMTTLFGCVLHFGGFL
jgi:hypothetical protein